MDAIRFTTRCDTARLEDDLAAAVRTGAWIAKPERGKYHQWSAIALHARHGSTAPDVDYHASPDQADECAPTPILAHCPYVRELLASFRSSPLRVRFMQLAAGGRIGKHRDRQYGWALPILRLHVPVITSPAVEFLLNNRRIDMRPGELWYLDTTRDHEVHNHGTIDRVHLVIDLVNTPSLRDQLGPPTWDLTVGS